MQASALLLCWRSYHWACNLLVLIIYLFFLPFMLPSVLPRLATDSAASVSWCLETSLKTPFPERDSLPRTELPPYLLCLFFHLLYFSYLFLKTMICFSGCLMFSASIQKLFCRIYSALKCSFDEFVREKMVSPSYFSTILGPPPAFLWDWNENWPFLVLWQLLSFPMLLEYWVQRFKNTIF